MSGGVSVAAGQLLHVESLAANNSIGNHLANAGASNGGGAYTVMAGDTLASIAAAVWGDASLWYLIAEANGLTGGEALAAGRFLTIPDRVTNVHNNGSTFRVYDPSRALGNLDPTQAKPVKSSHHGCGIVGQILLVAVAVAVTAIVAGPASAAIGHFLAAGLTGAAAATATTVGTIIGGALAGAAGSIVSQGLGVATGLQDKFSWKSVGLAAIAGGVGGGLQGVKFLNSGTIFSDALRGATSSALTQGIGIATGLQKKFDWTGVAIGAAATVASSAVMRALSPNGTDNLKLHMQRTLDHLAHNITDYSRQAVSGMAGAVAGAAARSLLTGTDFGDNLIAELPNAVGATIGLALADRVALAGRAAEPHVQLAQTGATPAPGASEQLNDQIVVYGHRPAPEHWYDRILDRLNDGAAWVGEHNMVTQLLYRASDGLEAIGLHRPATYLHAAGTFTAAASKTILTDAVGVLRVPFHPQETVLGIAGGVDRVLTSDASDVTRAIRRSYHSFASGNLEQKATMLGNGAGHFAFGLATAPISELSVARGVTLLEGGSTLERMSAALRPAVAEARAPAPVAAAAAERRVLFSSNELEGVERASQSLLDAVGRKREISWATPGSDGERFLNMRGAEAASFPPDTEILLRPNPSKAAVLEEFLHGTQSKVGVLDRLGRTGIGSAETHVKDFMIRHQRMLGLGAEDVRRLQTLRDMGL